MKVIPYVLYVVIMAALVNGLIGTSPSTWTLMDNSAAGARNERHLPLTTLGVLLVTGIFTALQFPFPGVLEALRRNPHALMTGEWWRIVTPLLVHSDGWSQIIFNFAAIAVFGVLVERIFGHWWWLLFYLVGGIAGEISGYAWDPFGAGASVGLFGLLGALLVWQILSLHAPRARIAAIIGLATMVALLVLRDIHGYATLAGVCLASLLLWRVRARKPSYIHPGQQ